MLRDSKHIGQEMALSARDFLAEAGGDRDEGAGLMEVSDQEESEWELFKLSVKMNTEFYDIGLLLIQGIN